MLPALRFPLAGQSRFGQNSFDASFSVFVLVIHHSLLIDALFFKTQLSRPPVKGVLPRFLCATNTFESLFGKSGMSRELTIGRLVVPGGFAPGRG
jgi:hypothetical protein